MKRFLALSLIVGLSVVAMLGCGSASTESKPANNSTARNAAPVDEVAEVRSQLSAEDKALVEAQEWCVVSTSERLGSMGPPLKLDINGQPVFVCCAGCKKKAEADPEKTLAKLAELKEKAKVDKGGA